MSLRQSQEPETSCRTEGYMRSRSQWSYFGPCFLCPKGVRSRATGQHIVLTPAVERIVARTTGKHVFSSISEQKIRTVFAEQAVVLATAIQVVIAV